MGRRLLFQQLQQPTDHHLRRYRHEQRYVILRHVPFRNFHLLRADIPDQITRSRRYFTLQRRSPVLRYPHQSQVPRAQSERSPEFGFSEFCAEI